MRYRDLVFSLPIAACLCAVSARADESSHKGGGPPKQAVEACTSKAAGDACSVTFDNGHASEGTCHTGADAASPLACMPKHMHHGPPKEAIDACKSLAAGATCSVTFDDHTIDGTCQARHDGEGPLACHPAKPRAD
jgi:hypothetical protein